MYRVLFGFVLERREKDRWSEKEHWLIELGTMKQRCVWLSRKRIPVNLNDPCWYNRGPTARSDIRWNVIEVLANVQDRANARGGKTAAYTYVHTSSVHARARLRLIQARIQECRRPREVIPGEERTRGIESLEGQPASLWVPDTRSSDKTLSRLASVRHVRPMNGLFDHLTLAILDSRRESRLVVNASWRILFPALSGFHLYQLHSSWCFTQRSTEASIGL